MSSASNGFRAVPQSVWPGLFVLLWSTGFIGAKLGLPHADPFTFLLLRFVLVVILMAGLAWWFKASWPKSRIEVLHIAIAGVLVHACYLGGVFSAIKAGMPAGVVALVTGLQPLLTAVAAGFFLKEQVTIRQWLGLGLGFVGVALVVSPKLGGPTSDLSGFPAAFIAVFSITAGTLYQKKFCTGMDLRSGSVIQYVASLLVMAALAPLTEPMHIAWTGSFLFALGWLTIVLSVGAITLLMALIRTGAAAKVASLFYLVPPTTAFIAFWVFDEPFTPVMLGGMILTAGGVALAARK
jgi:drug/metabolite transporter (DMT)-like permease